MRHRRQNRRRYGALVLCLASLACSNNSMTPRIDPYARDWALDPKKPGPDLPPAGRSLFDLSVGDPVPFPFSDLVQHLQATEAALPLRRVLIPLGRSLQRSAAAPEFFKYPRAVAAFGDRLFLGYQEKAGIIEVLSYNDDGGRFEFQLVKNYRAGAKPVVYYARRAVCTVCHQNQAPIFPRQLWDETNANSGISRLLMRQNRDFYGFRTEETADVPYEIDNAVHRANEFSVVQQLWREADSQLRAAWVVAALQYRLTGDRTFDRGSAQYQDQLLAPLKAKWRARWPRGIRISNPEIANRNPLAILSRNGPNSDSGIPQFLASRQKNIDPQFEPAAPRPPLEIWAVTEPERVERAITGLGRLITDQDIRAIDEALRRTAGPMALYRASCTSATEGLRVDVHCSPSAVQGFAMDAYMHGREGVIRRLTLAGVDPMTDVRVSAGRLYGRTGEGNRIERVVPSAGKLMVTRDFDAVRMLIQRMASENGPLSSNVFRHRAVMNAILAGLDSPVLPQPDTFFRVAVVEEGR